LRRRECLEGHGPVDTPIRSVLIDRVSPQSFSTPPPVDDFNDFTTTRPNRPVERPVVQTRFGFSPSYSLFPFEDSPRRSKISPAAAGNCSDARRTNGSRRSMPCSPTHLLYFSTPRSFSTAFNLAFVVFVGSIVAVRRPSRPSGVRSTPDGYTLSCNRQSGSLSPALNCVRLIIKVGTA